MNLIPSIGLEIHVQLDTRTKMFCGCRTDFGAPPNTLVCPVCLGYPGALPVMNAAAVRLTVLAGLLLGCRINPRSKFDRKHYFYPDMPKNYQISQYDQPLCLGGALEVPAGDGADAPAVKVRLTRIHLEEDVAKNMHFREASRVDFNRAGLPLMEIVTEPDMCSPQQAFDFLLALKQILVYGGISRCNLEEGNMRCDINCSLRPHDRDTLGVKTEIKNMNTFKGVFQALTHEIRRQSDLLRSGAPVLQETRRWDVERGMTASMRTKEDAHDYRYFPDPDLMPVAIADDMLRECSRALPELPRDRCARMAREYGIPDYDARVLAADKHVADFFEQTARLVKTPKSASNWIMTDMLRLLAEHEMDITAVRITPAALAELIGLVDDQTVNMTAAREIFALMFEQGGMPAPLVRERGLAQISDDGALAEMVEKALRDNPKSVNDFRAGKPAALKYLMGQVMRMCRGKANPRKVDALLQQRLDQKQ